MKRRIAVFASGSGTNFEAIVRACADGRIDAECVLMVCDKPGAKVIERAEQYIAEHGDDLLKADEADRRKALVAFSLPKNVEKMKADLKRDGQYIEKDMKCCDKKCK